MIKINRGTFSRKNKEEDFYECVQNHLNEVCQHYHDEGNEVNLIQWNATSTGGTADVDYFQVVSTWQTYAD